MCDLLAILAPVSPNFPGSVFIQPSLFPPGLDFFCEKTFISAVVPFRQCFRSRDLASRDTSFLIDTFKEEIKSG